MNEETLILTITGYLWNEGAGRYEARASLSLAMRQAFQFYGILISLEPSPPFVDPQDSSAAIVLRRLGPLERGMHVYEKRGYSQVPEVRIAGETIMRQAEFFYFSNLAEVEYVRIYNGSPEDHAEFIETTVQARNG